MRSSVEALHLSSCPPRVVAHRATVPSQRDKGLAAFLPELLAGGRVGLEGAMLTMPLEVVEPLEALTLGHEAFQLLRRER